MGVARQREREAVEAGHVEVGDQDVDAFGAEDRLGLQAVRGVQDLVPRAREERREDARQVAASAPGREAFERARAMRWPAAQG